MARRIVSLTTLTPTAFADTTTMTSAAYFAIWQGGSTSQLVRIHEISLSGQAASSSSPTFVILGRDSTTASTNSLGAGQNDAPVSPLTAALAAPTLTGNTNTTAPQRSATLHLLNCSLNAFGGVYFWRANKWDECIELYGSAANIGEASLSAFTGGTPGACGMHAVYEAE